MTLTVFSKKIISYSFGLILVLIVVRAKVLGLGYLFTLTNPNQLAKLIFSSYYDIVYSLGIALFFMAIAFLLRYKSKALELIFWIFFIFIILHILVALGNERIIEMLGVPFNYRWMYYSDMLQNNESLIAITENISLKIVIRFLVLSLISVGVGISLSFILTRWSHNGLNKQILILCISGIFIIYFIVAKVYIKINNISYSKIANPVIAFAESFNGSYETEVSLFKIKIPSKFNSFENPKLLKNDEGNAPSHKKVRNVIIFVLESVHSNYVSGYTNKFKVTPTIEKHLNDAIVFSDIYAHSPSTNNALVSMLGSIYPMISYKSISSEIPQIDWPTLSSELKKNNYRTGFFQASDNSFKMMDKFLSYRRFDKIMDFKTLPCHIEVIDSEWENLDGVDEACMLNGFIDWLEKDNIEKPFFATLWTMRTHYPYFASGRERDYSVNDHNFNRYLNALQYSDSILGELLVELKQKNLEESTLIVVVGDHGEAFLQHDQYGHASHIYEENIKVPLIMINPILFNGQKKSVIGGQVDIAPTIMDILGLPAPPEWQGENLFAIHRNNHAYFFSPWSEYLFGYRTSNYKVIYNANENKTMVFDLSKDSLELNDLSEKMPDFVELSYMRLANWVQFQTSFLKEKIHQPVYDSQQKKTSIEQ